MHLKIWFPLMILLVLFTACAPVESEPPPPVTGDPNENPVSSETEGPPWNTYAPAKGDESKDHADVYIDSQDILTLESFPPQYQLQIKGSLPTPCHELRVVAEGPNEDSEIRVQVYSVVDPDMVCTQVLEPFEASIPLGSYTRGSYTVLLNGQEVGTITP